MAMPKIYKQEVGMAVCNKGRGSLPLLLRGWVEIDEVAIAHDQGQKQSLTVPHYKSTVTFGLLCLSSLRF